MIFEHTDQNPYEFICFLVATYFPPTVYTPCCGHVQIPRTGRGIYFHPNGSKYLGEFQNNNRHGQGVYFYPDNTVEEGFYIENNFLEIDLKMQFTKPLFL